MKFKLMLTLIIYSFYGCSGAINKQPKTTNCDTDKIAKPYSLNALKYRYNCESDRGIIK